MTGAMLTATIIDIILALAVIIGLINEEKLIDFEDRIIDSLARVWKRYMRRRIIKKRAKQRAHLRVISNNRNYNTYNRTA